MEEFEKAKITATLPKLIEQIDCNIALITQLRSTEAIGLADECQLVTFTNTLERSNQLLKIMFTRKNGYKLLVDGLKKLGQTGALETLKESTDLGQIAHQNIGAPKSQLQIGQLQISKGAPETSGLKHFKKVPFHTQEANELFTGRHKELDILLRTILSDGGTASIIGIGGIGKTELAKIFLQTLDDEKYENIFKQIVWINCESPFTATTDFTNIARDYLEVPILGSSSQQRDISSILNDVYDKMQKSKSLVVLDNVETRETLQTFMPKSFSKKSKLSIVITSQNAVLKIGTQIVLEKLELHEAIEFFRKGLAITGPVAPEIENGISELVSRLEMFPLAISQAIGYINEKMEMNPNYQPQNYLVDFDRIPKKLLDGEYFINVSSQGKTTFKTLVLALEKIETCKNSGLLATKILSKVAFMAPDNIPSSFFLKLAENDGDAIESALILIRRLSIIKYTPVGESSEVYFSIHRVVQDVLRICIAQRNESESILHSIMTTFRLNLDYDLFNHALVTWGYVAKYPTLVIEFFEFPENLMVKMRHVGQISDAIDFATSSLNVLKQNSTTNEHVATILWLQALQGLYLSYQGKFKDSLKILKATLNEAKLNLHSDHSTIFKLRYFIALVYRESGQNGEASLICDELYSDHKLGNITSLRSIYEIGVLMMNLRKFEKGLELVNCILENLRLSPNKENDRIEYDTKHLLASIYGRLGKYDEALILYNEILQSYLKKEKNDDLNYEIWRILNQIGTFQYFAGSFEDAQDSIQKALKALKEMSRQNEKDSVWILYTKCAMALIMLARNVTGEVLSFCIEIREITKNLVDESHFLASYSLALLGMAYSKLGKHQDAVSILTKIVENESYVKQCEDEAIVEKFYLALSLEQIGGFEKAIEIMRDLRLKCFELPQFKVYTLEQVESALERLNEKEKDVFT